MSTTTEVMRGRDWRSNAACRGVDPDLFFPEVEFGPAYDASVTAATEICAQCPVRAECLDFALRALPHGIAAGRTEEERRRLRGPAARPFLSRSDSEAAG